MKKIIICTHGKFGEELVHSAEMIVGPIKDIEVFSLLPGMNPIEYKDKIQSFIQENYGNEFLCMADLYGGTPSNMLASLIPLGNIEVVTGLNLSMLIEVYTQLKHMNLTELKKCALSTLNSSGYDLKQELQKIIERKNK